MTSLDEMKRELRERYEMLSRDPVEERRDSEAVKRYTLWIERLEKAGLRDPEDPFKIISPSDPRTRKEIERLKIELEYAKGEIGLDEYHRRYERLSRNPEPKVKETGYWEYFPISKEEREEQRNRLARRVEEINRSLVTVMDKKPLNLWHGTRRLETKEQIKKEGICTLTCDAAYWEAIHALSYFDKLHVLGEKTTDGNLLRNELSHLCRMDKLGFWVDAYDPQAPSEKREYPKTTRTCEYAKRNPEIISTILDLAGVPGDDISEYLKERFGKPYSIKLKHKLLGEYINLSAYTRCFEPEDIEEIYECED